MRKNETNIRSDHSLKYTDKLSQEKGSLQYSRLHPLIHAFPRFAQAQDLVKKKAELKTPHFLYLDQDIVAWSRKQKCGLKYVK
jgi:hypothetical protein